MTKCSLDIYSYPFSHRIVRDKARFIFFAQLMNVWGNNLQSICQLEALSHSLQIYYRQVNLLSTGTRQ